MFKPGMRVYHRTRQLSGVIIQRIGKGYWHVLPDGWTQAEEDRRGRHIWDETRIIPAYQTNEEALALLKTSTL